MLNAATVPAQPLAPAARLAAIAALRLCTGLASNRPLTTAVTALEQAGRLRWLPSSRGLILVPRCEAAE